MTLPIRMTFLLAVLAGFHGPAAAQTLEALPPDSAYVVVRDGHLTLNGQRVRFWGAIGGFPGGSETVGGDPYAAQRALVRRMRDLGFNMVRLWHHGNAVAKQNDTYAKGDLSPLDRIDFFLALCAQEGIRVWSAGTPAAGTATTADVGVVNDPATAAAWHEAVAAMAAKDAKTGLVGVRLLTCPAILWDARLEALCIRAMRETTNHRNQHNGLRWADDPVIAVWELTNEQWMMRKLVGGQWQGLPPFFRRGLFERWHAFLKAKYADDAGLAAAWGALLPGESLAEGSVLLAPLAKEAKIAHLNDTNPDALAALQAGANPYGPKDLPVARGRDVLEFFVGLHVAHKQRVAAAVKAFGKSCRLSPLLWDTGIGYEIQSQYLHQQADAVTHCAYVNGQYSHRKAPEGPCDDELHRLTKELEWLRTRSNRGDWLSGLDLPPGLAAGVPWMEHNRAPDKPFFAYETQINQPAKYRADYPLRVAALAAIQDWDVVCWHTMGGVERVATDPRPFDRVMDMANPDHKPQGYHYRYDEVESAMIRAAGFAFRAFAFAPAASPTTFVFGRKSLYDPTSMRYAGSYGVGGLDMLPTTYQHGVRLVIDPTRAEDEVRGPVVKFADYAVHNPYTPTPEIVFDWKRGFLSMDAPKAVAWVGFLARYGADEIAFRQGPVLRDVRIINAPGMYEPMSEEERYMAFSLHSLDARPLAESRRLSLSAVSTSFNSGFQLDATGGYRHKRGTLPVLTARVGATVAWPALDGMRYVFRDWHMQQIAEGVVDGGQLVLPADQPVFVVELER